MTNSDIIDSVKWITGTDLGDRPTTAEIIAIALAIKANLSESIRSDDLSRTVEIRKSPVMSEQLFSGETA